MSRDIYEFDELTLTAFCGKEGDASIQITIGGYPFRAQALTSKEALNLAIAILQRVNRVEGFRATD